MLALVTELVVPGRPPLGRDQMTKPVPAAVMAASAAAWIAIRNAGESEPFVSNATETRGTMYEPPRGRRVFRSFRGAQVIPPRRLPAYLASPLAGLASLATAVNDQPPVVNPVVSS